MDESSPLRVVWHGHSTVELTVGGSRLLTDPLLRRGVGHLRRHAPPVVLTPGPVDVVLISHIHHDHLDVPSLRRLGRRTQMVVPRGAAPLLRNAGFSQVDEVEAGDVMPFGGAKVTAVHASHKPERAFSDVRATPVGYLVEGPEGLVYFAGDTDVFPGMADLPHPDLALLPIWGWGRRLGPGHLDPSRAAMVAAMLQARAVLPIHWGTMLPRGPQLRPPSFLWLPSVRFAAELAEKSPTTVLHLCPPGGEIIVT